MKITLQSVVAARTDVYATSVDGELVLFDPMSDSYYGAGLVGQKIWSLVSEDRKVQDICNELLETFDVDRDTCQANVMTFLQGLEEAGLIQTVRSE